MNFQKCFSKGNWLFEIYLSKGRSRLCENGVYMHVPGYGVWKIECTYHRMKIVTLKNAHTSKPIWMGLKPAKETGGLKSKRHSMFCIRNATWKFHVQSHFGIFIIFRQFRD